MLKLISFYVFFQYFQVVFREVLIICNNGGEITEIFIEIHMFATKYISFHWDKYERTHCLHIGCIHLLFTLAEDIICGVNNGGIVKIY